MMPLARHAARPRPLALVCGAALVTLACNDAPTRSAMHPLAAFERARRLAVASLTVADSDEGEPDRTYLAMQRQVPGFGGLFIDATGTPTIYLTDTTQRSAATAVVAPRIAGMNALGSALPPTIRILQGTYNWRQLKTWQHALNPIFSVPGAFATDADEARNRVSVDVIDAAAAARVETALQSLPIPRAAVLINITAQPQAFKQYSTDSIRPLQGGLAFFRENGDTIFFCTIGLQVDSSFGFFADNGFLTASHCSPHPGSSGSATYYQGTIRGQISSNVFSDVAPSKSVPGCPPPYYCRRADAMMVDYSDNVAHSFAYLAQMDRGDSGITALTKYNMSAADWDAQENVVGQVVNKQGERTGFSTGSVEFTGKSFVELGYVWKGSSDSVVMLNSTVVHGTTPMSKPGDSGAGVYFTRTNGLPAVEGILWSGSDSTFIFSTINEFKTEYGGAEPKVY